MRNTIVDTDEEGEPAIVEVLAARPDRQSGKYGTTQWQPLDKAASQLKGKAAKEDRLPTVKTMRPGDYANTSLFGQPAARGEDAEMIDASTLTKQSHKGLGGKDKLTFRWLGPFRMAEAFVDKGTYILEELDGARMKGKVAGSRLKRFDSRTELEGGQDCTIVDKGDRSEDDQEENARPCPRPRHQAEVQMSESERARPVQPGLAVVIPALQSHQPLDFVHTS